MAGWTKEGRLSLAICLSLCFMMVEIVGGYWANSIAIFSDAAHLLTDIAGFAISLIAIYFTKHPGNTTLTFGLARVEVLGALISVLLLWIICAFLVVEALSRGYAWYEGRGVDVDGKLMFMVACFGVCVNLCLGLVFHEDHGSGGEFSPAHSHSHEHGCGHGHEAHHDDHHNDHHQPPPSTTSTKAKQILGLSSSTTVAYGAVPVQEAKKEEKGHGHDHDHKHKAVAHNTDHGHKHGHDHVENHGHGLSHKEVRAAHHAEKMAERAEMHAAHPHTHGHTSKKAVSEDKHAHDHSHGHGHEHCDGHQEADEESGGVAMSSYQNSSSSASSSSKAVVTAACDSHDDHHTTHGRAHNEPRDVNMEAAYLHVLTDLMQSAGVALAGLVIWWRPAYQIIDPICTLLFSTVALSATVPLLKRIFLVFFEGTPSHVAFEGVHERFMAIPGVTDVHDLHIWSISAKSVSLTCHMCAVDPQAALLAAQEQCRKLGIDHVTIQITSEGCASAHCSDDSGVGCYKH